MSDRNNPQIIRNCKKAINLAFLPYQIEESFVSLQIRIGFNGNELIIEYNNRMFSYKKGTK